jgi:hypothetical protein
MRKAILSALFVILTVRSGLAAQAPTMHHRIQELAEMYGNVTTVSTKTNLPIKMMFAFLYKVNGADEAKEYQVVTNAKEWVTDEALTGTLTLDCVLRYACRGLAIRHHESRRNAITALQQRAHDLLSEMHQEGVVFGFDGHSQNSGATTYLLIVDPKHRKVHGLDLAYTEDQ